MQFFVSIRTPEIQWVLIGKEIEDFIIYNLILHMHANFTLQFIISCLYSSLQGRELSWLGPHILCTEMSDTLSCYCVRLHVTDITGWLWTCWR